MFKVEFHDSVGWIAGTELFRSIDGGRTWAQVAHLGLIFEESPASLSGLLSFVDTTVAYSIVGHWQNRMRGLSKTENAGKAWEKAGDLPEKRIDWIQFHSRDFGHLGAGRRLWKTTSGGASWQKELEERVIGVCFITPKIGYLAGHDGGIYQTTPDAPSWHRILIVEQRIRDIKCTDEAILLAGDDCFAAVLPVGSNQVRELYPCQTGLPRSKAAVLRRIAANGDWIAFSSLREVLIGRNQGTGIPVEFQAYTAPPVIADLAFSPEGQLFVVGGLAPGFWFGTPQRTVAVIDPLRSELKSVQLP